MAKKKGEGKLTSAAKTLGAAGASQGGRTRARVLTAAQRKEIARQGGKAGGRGRGKA